MSAAPVAQQAELIITILSGPDKGANYKLVSARVSLGRANDNDIVIKDPRSSRHHAVIELTPEGIYVSDTSSQNGIDVDGNITKKAILKSGSHITLGSTVLRFDIRSQMQALGPAIGGNSPVPMGTGTGVPQIPKTNLHTSVTSQSGGFSAPQTFKSAFGGLPSMGGADAKKKNFYIILGVVGLALIYLLTDTIIKRKEVAIRTEAMVDEELKAAQERRTNLEKEQQKKGIDSAEYKQTQAFYQQGFRDYREGNYPRALSEFDATLALNPSHELARKYRELAKRRLDELIQVTMLEGKRYMEQNKYNLAKNAYYQVMILINDPKNKQYKEAQEYFAECELLLKGTY